jgi:hypothetical protein
MKINNSKKEEEGTKWSGEESACVWMGEDASKHFQNTFKTKNNLNTQVYN